MGEERWERREEKRRERSMWMRIVLGDLHPHPPKKLFHVLVVIALIVEQAWKKKRERDGKEKKATNSNTCKSIKLAMYVIWVI